jgi:hypothetical protein
VLFLICWALSVIGHLRSTFAPDWMRSLVLLSGLLTSLVTLGRQLPLQNVVLVGILFSVAGALWAGFVGASLNWGHGPNWGTTVFWAVVLLNARAIGQFLLRSRRSTSHYGWELMGVAAGVFTVVVAALYKQALLIVVAPLAAAVVLFCTLPIMLSKRAGEPPVSWQPIVVLTLLLAWGLLPRL